MEQTLSYHARWGWYNIDYAYDFYLLFGTEKWRSTYRARLTRLQTIQADSYSCPISQLVHHLRETHVDRVCRSNTFTLVRDASEECWIPNFGQLLYVQIEEDWGRTVCGLALRYDQNVLIDSIFDKLHNGLLYYCEQFHNTTSIEHLRGDCKVAYVMWVL